jgi:hypothetical protein
MLKKKDFYFRFWVKRISLFLLKEKNFCAINKKQILKESSKILSKKRTHSF